MCQFGGCGNEESAASGQDWPILHLVAQACQFSCCLHLYSYLYHRTTTRQRLTGNYREIPSSTSDSIIPLRGRCLQDLLDVLYSLQLQQISHHHGFLKHFVRLVPVLAVVRTCNLQLALIQQQWLTASCYSRLVNLAIGTIMVLGGTLRPGSPVKSIK